MLPVGSGRGDSLMVCIHSAANRWNTAWSLKLLKPQIGIIFIRKTISAHKTIHNLMELRCLCNLGFICRSRNLI